MKKVFFISLAIVIILFATLYTIDIPVKSTISDKKIDLSDYGCSVILCKYVQSTGVDWKIKETHNLPEDIEELKLSFRNITFFIDPLFCQNDLIFAGTYNPITKTFHIDKWHMVGEISKINRKENYQNNRVYIQEYKLWMGDYMIAYK